MRLVLKELALSVTETLKFYKRRGFSWPADQLSAPDNILLHGIFINTGL